VVELSRFLPRLLPYVVGCTEPLAKQALLDSAIDFCSRTNVVSITLDPITVLQGVSTYELDTPAQTGVSAVQRVWYEGKILAPAPYEQATELYNQPNGSPRFYYGEYVDEVYSITLTPAPDRKIVNGMRVRVSLTPTRTATQVHDILFDRYAEGIVHGALAILAAVPDQPFTDPVMAGASAIKARAETAIARGEAMHGNVQSSLSVKMRPF
jgi:hypothetical protein